MIDLYKRLEYANPEELAANMWLETNAPHILFKNNPLVQEAIQMLTAQAQAKEEKERSKDEESHKRDLEKEDRK